MIDAGARIERILAETRTVHAQAKARRRSRHRRAKIAMVAFVFVGIGAASALGAEHFAGLPVITSTSASGLFPSSVSCTPMGSVATCVGSDASPAHPFRYQLTATLSLAHIADATAVSALPALIAGTTHPATTQSAPPADSPYRDARGAPLALACVQATDLLRCNAVGVGTGLPDGDDIGLYELSSG